MLVRDIQPSDFDELVQISYDAWTGPTFKGLVPADLSYEQVRHYRLDSLQSYPHLLLQQKAVSKSVHVSNVCGYLVAGYPRPGQDAPSQNLQAFIQSRSDVKLLELWSIYVARDFQGQGIGRLLMEEMRALCRREGAFGFYLWAYDGNHAAAEFYRRLGGVKVGRRRNRYFGAWNTSACFLFPTDKDEAGEAVIQTLSIEQEQALLG